MKVTVSAQARQFSEVSSLLYAGRGELIFGLGLKYKSEKRPQTDAAAPRTNGTQSHSPKIITRIWVVRHL